MNRTSLEEDRSDAATVPFIGRATLWVAAAFGALAATLIGVAVVAHAAGWSEDWQDGLQEAAIAFTAAAIAAGIFEWFMFRSLAQNVCAETTHLIREVRILKAADETAILGIFPNRRGGEIETAFKQALDEARGGEVLLAAV